MTTPERLTEIQAEIAAVSASILSLLGKTRQTVSFGDQSYGLSDVEKLIKIRTHLRQEESGLENRLNPKPRRTHKVYFG